MHDAEQYIWEYPWNDGMLQPLFSDHIHTGIGEVDGFEGC